MILACHNLNKSFGERIIVKDGSFHIEDREKVAFVGVNGAGKSTILKMIIGEEPTDSGNIILTKGKTIGYLAQQQNLISGNSIYEELKTAKADIIRLEEQIRTIEHELKSLSGDELQTRLNTYNRLMSEFESKNGYAYESEIIGVLKGLGFQENEFSKEASTLSGGQKTRVSLGKLLLTKPDILLLDEPLSALDYKMRQEMQIELKNMHKELGITFIFVTHDQEEALMMSDKIVVMSKGQIQQVGTPEEIYNKPQNAFVADFIGESNIFDGMKKEGNLIHFAHHDFVCHDDHEPGTRLDVVIRPEDVVLTTPDKGKFTGEVISCLFCGKFYEVAVLSDKNEIEAHILHELTPGTKVGVDFTADTIHTMPKDLKVNHYIGTIDKDGWLELTDGRIPVKEKEPKAHPEGTRLKMYFPSKLAKLSDDPEEGYFQGNIISIIYKGDHYNYRVLSENKVEYSVDDEDLWNIGDFVSVVVPEDAMVFESVSEDAE